MVDDVVDDVVVVVVVIPGVEEIYTFTPPADGFDLRRGLKSLSFPYLGGERWGFRIFPYQCPLSWCIRMRWRRRL